MTPEGGNHGELDSLARQLRVATETINQLAARLFAVESRLEQMEMGHTAAPRVVTPPPLPPVAASVEKPLPPVVQEFMAPHATPPPLPPPPPQVPLERKIETQVGLTWANRIGVITLIIGVAFVFKYLVDNEYIGQGGRVIIGVIAGALTLFAGDLLWHRNQKTFAQGLTALGMGTLYLSFYAAFGYYKLIPAPVALILMLVTTALGGAFALRYNARVIAILALLGGYFTPVMLSTGTPNDVFYACYMAVLNGIALWVARRQKWRSVEIVALVLTFCLEAAWLADRHSRIGDFLGVSSTLAQYAIFASGPMWPIAAFAQIVATIVIASFHWQPIVQLALAVVGIGLFHWRKWIPGPVIALLAWWFAFIVGIDELPDPLEVHAFLYSAIGFLIFLAWPVYLAVSRRELPKTAELVSLALNGVIFYAFAHKILHEKYADYMGLMAVLVAVCYLVAGYLIWNAPTADKRDSRTPMLAAGMAMAFLALAVPIQFTGYRIAIAWAIQSAALAWIASRMPSPRILIGAAVVAVLALGDLPTGITYAPEHYRPLLNSGFITMAVVAISLWLFAYFTTKTPEVPEFAAGPPYVMGHVVFLSGLHYEIFSYLDWTKHSWNAKLLASTVLLAVYGLGLLMIGIRTRTVINRVMGLVLFGIVILKLYLSDVWLFDVIFKMIAFLVLGGLLVAGSYLYSRYRARIETLWKKDDATNPA
jgi:hypothetical protein